MGDRSLLVYPTDLMVFTVIPAPTVLCRDTLSPAEFEARIALTSLNTVSTEANYIQARAHIRTTMSTRVKMAVLTTLKGCERRRCKYE